ncbi:MAG: hypothetical protein H0U74_07730 [Bradymonadaceae bacterium]|nr:hypothetical protein [Lujinxingiaceae bacterium]
MRWIKSVGCGLLAVAIVLSAVGCGPEAAKFSEPDLVSTVLSGTIDGHDYAFVSGTINKVTTPNGTSYVVGLKNYEWECGPNSPRPLPEPALVVNFEVLERKAGLVEVSFADGHGGAMQVNVDAAQIKTIIVDDGLLRLDNWTTEAGQEVSGALVFEGANSTINGTFKATVCP